MKVAMVLGLVLAGVVALPAAAHEGAVVNVRPPGVHGDAVFGEELRASPGEWDPTDAVVTYRWLRDSRFVPGARESTYVLGEGDLGHRIAVQASATDAQGNTGRAVSEPTSAVVRADLASQRPPEVRGVARYTRSVTADPGWGSPEPSRVRFQWLRAGAPIAGATSRRYTFAPGDVGARVRVQVTAYARGHRPATMTSKAGPVVRHQVDVRRTVTYSVTTRGRISANLSEFRRQAQQTYDDPRGWRGMGVRFRPVARGGSFTLVLAQASRVPTFSSQCSSMWSCRVGRYVIINQTRWQRASPRWNQAGESRRDYRNLVVNHETGHWLGRGHASCPGPGQLAPVMMQQSKGVQGCRFNPWPTATELRSR